MRRALAAVLAPFGSGATATAVVVGHVALAVLIATGETIRWIDYRDTLVSAPMLRAAHVLAGTVLAAAVGMRLGSWLGRGLHRAWARARGLGVPRGRAAFQWQERQVAATVLDAAWWLVLAGLVLSGVERYLQLRHGMSVLPVLPPAAWWLLHRPLLPYLYALLLINLAVRGRMVLNRALEYLYTP